MRRLVFLVALLSASPSWGLGAGDLVGDAERLYNQMEKGDATRQSVALRLADLLFDAAIELDANAQAGRKEMDRADAYRRKAEKLYEENLASLKGESRLRVKFQLSRLYAHAGNMEPAKKYWRELIAQKDNLRLRRESALHLAEQLELSSQPTVIAEASDLYMLALPLADKDSMKSYVTFRLAWTQFRTGQPDKAVATMDKVLAMSASDKERDELLRDYILFLSRQQRPAKEQIAILRDYEKKFAKTGLVLQLGEAYYAADRKADYVVVMSDLNSAQPDLERTVNILDAAHDTLSKPEITAHLQQIQTLKLAGQKFKDEAAEKTARDRIYRLVVLWDGQRRVKAAEWDGLFTKGVDTMLVVFPDHEDTKKSMGGWLAAHEDKQQQLDQVNHWLSLTQPLSNPKLETSLRKYKLEAARQLKQWTVVVEESQRLEVLTAEQTREGRYQRAKALYELKDYDKSLPIFLELGDSKTADEITKFSQDLALDTFAIQKRYDDIIAYSQKWRSTGARAVEMASLEDGARFERAVATQNGEALAQFTSFCLAKKMTPKSCDNAKSLAAKLRDQDQLVTVLQAQGDQSELARQLEISGRFGEAARLQEKTAKSDLEILKVAMLFELQGEMKERDRVLKGFTALVAKRKKPMSNEEQALLYLTLSDAGLLDDSTLKLEWSEEYRLKIASKVYAQNSSGQAQKILAAYCGPAGDSWASVHLAQIKQSYNQQAAIKFHGAQSKSKFEARVKGLKKLGTEADCLMKGASPELRVATGRKMHQAFTEFAELIRATPIPEGLDEEMLKQVNVQIAEMAKPFDQTGDQWKALADQTIEQQPPDQREALAARVPAGWNFEIIGAAPAVNVADLKFDWKPMLEEIRKQPFERQPQESLKQHFEQKGSKRLAAYMNGRLQNLESQ